MQIKNNSNIGGYLGLTPIPASDFPAITPPDSGVGTIANNATLNALVRWDGTTWQPFASTSDAHPALTLDSFSQSSWLVLDNGAQELGLSIPVGAIGDNLLTEDHFTEAEVLALIATAKQETKDEIIDGADGTWDTLAEIAAELEADNAQAASILADIAANDADIAALQADSHVAATVAAGSDTELSITGQELNLDLSAVKAQINTNSTGIGNNLNAISANASDIQDNADDIEANETQIQANTNLSHDALVIADTMENPGLVLNDDDQEIYLAELDLEYDINTREIGHNYGGDGVVIPLATPLNDGLMTGDDKSKLENIVHLCEDFAVSDWVAAGNQYTYTFSDSLIEPGFVYNVRVVDANGDAVIVDNKENSGNITLTVNGIPDCRFGGRVYVTLNLEVTF